MDALTYFLTALVAVFLGMGRKAPPVSILIRKARPFFAVFAVIFWFIHRILHLSGQSPDLSLLHLVLKGLEWMELCCLMIKDELRIKWQLPEALLSALSLLMKWLWLLFQDVMALLCIRSTCRFLYKAHKYSLTEIKDAVVQDCFEFAHAHMPFVQRELLKIRAQTQADIRHSLGKKPGRSIHLTLPSEGVPHQQLLKLMKERSMEENKTWQSGKISGTVYPADASHTQLMNQVYALYSWSNPLHIGVWPSVNQYEAEVVTMAANMLRGNNSAVGTTTSGGTESIILAIRAHVEYYGRRRGIETPEIICGPTAHCSVDKACDLIRGLRLVRVECDPETYTLVPSAVQKAISSNTVLIYASAPCYPQGVIDPVEELSALALQYDIGLHVDACLGGFVLPFARKLGRSIPKFDFECPGVTSMSVDTHKYGYSSKGTSVVLYRDEELRRAQYFACAQWTGGLYITPTIAGSRPGALFACAWAAMMSHGESGYKSRVKLILEASEKLANGIAAIHGLHLLGTQIPTMVVCFGSNEFDIYRVGDDMTKKGYELNALQRPACLHVCVTQNTVENVDELLNDLQQSVAKVKASDSTKKQGRAAIYGMAGSFSAGPVNEILQCVPDAMFTP